MKTYSEFISKEFFINLKYYNDVNIHFCYFNPHLYDDMLFEEFNIDYPDGMLVSAKKRRREFLAGRYSAKKNLEYSKSTSHSVHTGIGRYPIFPSPYIGSISHTDNIACTAVTSAKNIKGLGIDIEKIISEKAVIDIESLVINEDEIKLVSQHKKIYRQILTLIFSAKESIFKSLYPHVQFYFGFEYFSLQKIIPHSNQMIFKSRKPLSESYPQEIVLTVSYFLSENWVFTIVTI